MKGSIAILGGTGTLGRSIVKELLINNPESAILIFSRDEIKQLEMMDDFPQSKFPNLQFKLGDVRDLTRLNEVLQGVKFVIHAAAIKHVVMAEMNPTECHKTNVVGTENVVKTCELNAVDRAILVSTDKAENPAGVYGHSKLKAEEIFSKANRMSPGRFGVVRLGNIVGARGSVFEKFEKQRKSGVIKVTHPEATRFCISQEDAAQWVLDAIENTTNDILTPPMKNFKVVDLARQIAPECKIEFIGLRPGDKLHEELSNSETNPLTILSSQELKMLLE